MEQIWPLAVVLLCAVGKGAEALPSRAAVLADAKHSNDYFHGVAAPGAPPNKCSPLPGHNMVNHGTVIGPAAFFPAASLGACMANCSAYCATAKGAYNWGGGDCTCRDAGAQIWPVNTSAPHAKQAEPHPPTPPPTPLHTHTTTTTTTTWPLSCPPLGLAPLFTAAAPRGQRVLKTRKQLQHFEDKKQLYKMLLNLGIV